MNEQRMATPVAQTAPDNAAAASPEVTTAPPPAGFWQQRVVQNVVPFLSSLTVHASIILVGALTLKVVQVVSRTNLETMATPAASEIQQTVMQGIETNPELKGPADNDLETLQDLDSSSTQKGWSDTKGADKQSILAGLEGSANQLDNGLIGFGPKLTGIGFNRDGTGDGGDGGIQSMFGPRQRGGHRDGVFDPKIHHRVRSVAYVCDASGSMLNNFDDLRRQISMSVSALQPVQFYNVIFFQGESAASASKSGLIQAFPENKRKTQSFLDDIAPSSTTDPLPALELAFKQKPDLIWLLTDGDFPDNKAVIEFIRRHNPDRKTQVNTIAFVNRGDEYEQVLKTIAADNRGEFKYVNEETLAK